jgi:hypothetical protein
VGKKNSEGGEESGKMKGVRERERGGDEESGKMKGV